MNHPDCERPALCAVHVGDFGRREQIDIQPPVKAIAARADIELWCGRGGEITPDFARRDDLLVATGEIVANLDMQRGHKIIPASV